MGFSTVIRSLASLFFPNLCLGCQQTIESDDQLLCVACSLDMPLSDSYLYAENAVTDRLAGRFPLVFGAFAYTFRRGTVCQRLIHALKYHDRPQVGLALGRHFGRHLLTVDKLRDVDGIVPVPLHPARLRQRGYNQAEWIARGLAESLQLPVYPRALRRTAFSGSQTTMNKLERLENVRNTFTLGKQRLADKHVLLVDDVLTTGATLDFCAHALLEANTGMRISIATLAMAER